MSAPCVHIVSLGVKNFENKINSRQLQSDSKEHQQEVYDYVQESLGGDFKQFSWSSTSKAIILSWLLTSFENTCGALVQEKQLSPSP